jgi:hypothetical protein
MAKFKKKILKLEIDDAEEAEIFLQGLIIAQSNNNSEYFPQLIAGVNAILEPYRKNLIQEQTLAAAGGSVTLEEDDDEED